MYAPHSGIHFLPSSYTHPLSHPPFLSPPPALLSASMSFCPLAWPASVPQTQTPSSTLGSAWRGVCSSTASHRRQLSGRLPSPTGQLAWMYLHKDTSCPLAARVSQVVIICFVSKVVVYRGSHLSRTFCHKRIPTQYHRHLRMYSLTVA